MKGIREFKNSCYILTVLNCDLFMKMPLDPEGNLLEHSEAKIRLLREYLRKYLSVVTNTDWIDEIEIFDVFCGPGEYGGGAEGSPLAILQVVNEIYRFRTENGKGVPKINCYFADIDVENVENVRRVVVDRNLHIPAAGLLSVEQRKFKDSLNQILSVPQKTSRKLFSFIDPTGYKEINATELRKLLDRKVEVLLFLPVQFMYRFVANATPVALKEFISELTDYDQWQPKQDPVEFAFQIRDLYRKYFGKSAYVSAFVIEKDANTMFCLYFFTTNLRGYLKMIEAKWDIDSTAGAGWSFRKVPGQASLLNNPEEYLENDLLEFLQQGGKTNVDVFEFAVIDNEFKETHAKKACDKLVAAGKIAVMGYSGEKVRAGSYYINYDCYKDRDRKVRFEVV